MRSSYGLGRSVDSQLDAFAAPLKAYQQPGTVPGVIMCHGSLHTAADVINPQYVGEFGIYERLRRQYCVGVGDFSGTTGNLVSVGNDASLADVETMRLWMQTTMGAKPGKIALTGASMGIVTALNYALAHPDNVSCIVGVIPAVGMLSDPAANLVNARNVAYGGTYDEATMGPTHNPLTYAPDFPDIPVHLWYSTADTQALPQYVEQFASTCPSATATIVSTTLDHTQAAIAAAPILDIEAFILANHPV